METLTPESYFLQQGILGIIIVVLSGVVIWQQRRLDKKDQDIKDLYKSLDIIQEKRINDNAQHISYVTSMGANLVNATTAIQKSVDNAVRLIESKS